jgi:hypothetical protein
MFQSLFLRILMCCLEILNRQRWPQILILFGIITTGGTAFAEGFDTSSVNALRKTAQAAPVFEVEINGNPDKRINITYLAEGYTASDLQGDWAEHVQLAWEYRLSEYCKPLPRYRKYFNVYSVDLVSEESGIGEPTKGIQRNTALDGTGSGRLGTVDRQKAIEAAESALEAIGTQPDWTFAVLNTESYYNSGGPICVFAYPYYGEIANHEAGHGFHDFADEYTYGESGTYWGDEPREINITAYRTAAKWEHWKGYNQPEQGVNGAYEGGYYHTSGIWRPTENSKMKDTGDRYPQFFNMPCMEKIIQDIYEIIGTPIDDSLPGGETHVNPDSLWVKLIDPEVVHIDWYVNDELAAENGGESFDILGADYETGEYAVRAEIYDEVVKHAHSDNGNPHELDMVRTGLENLQWTREWSVELDASAQVTGPALVKAFTVLSQANHEIVFHSPEDQTVYVTINGLSGRSVSVPGAYTAREGINRMDISSSRLSKGIYFAKFKTAGRTVIHRILITQDL